MIEMLDGIIEWTGAYVAFGVVMLGIFGAATVAVLFAGLALYGACRWLRRHSWRDVVTRVETKAFRRN